MKIKCRLDTPANYSGSYAKKLLFSWESRQCEIKIFSRKKVRQGNSKKKNILVKFSSPFGIKRLRLMQKSTRRKKSESFEMADLD
jgi:hypothetical protein